MFDARLRTTLAPALDRAAGWLDVPWVTPNRLTGLNLIAGLASAVLAATQLWIPALLMWLLCRVADGLDGPLARRRRAQGSSQGSAQGSASGAPGSPPGSSQSPGQGGFFDICADFIVYGATVIGVAIGATAAFDAPWLPFLLVLFAYYINGGAFLAFSSIAEKEGKTLDDGRSLSFLGGLAEGGETVLVHSLWLIFPAAAVYIASVWAVLVCLSAAQRILAGFHALR
ncbi:CDP-alcohol phosphatidyltransferase family protein [Nesterenkonia sp. E16_7]|uniref:CDP-alcohol phosphatidyltransferase family protein n=1 Tax=unclassified Nesterenkonia TaxID=2629769 RepID=UPI001A9316AA|nr:MULTISPECIES: CDP-alcohol phosphatidyltransferase family protein [unclassified Nesterenkonia]MBO0594971.1 CDP-alcohol phosphatidyltransferase family protein [Nesterenkonia sp. E16_10]MBO0598626.1 CDP-alcohol phosphatidyltransferase family protein [Nesterenkonia sp. E16_7]